MELKSDKLELIKIVMLGCNKQLSAVMPFFFIMKELHF